MWPLSDSVLKAAKSRIFVNHPSLKEGACKKNKPKADQALALVSSKSYVREEE